MQTLQRSPTGQIDGFDRVVDSDPLGSQIICMLGSGSDESIDTYFFQRKIMQQLTKIYVFNFNT